MINGASILRGAGWRCRGSSPCVGLMALAAMCSLGVVQAEAGGTSRAVSPVWAR